MISISMASMSGSFCSRPMASRPLSADTILHLVLLQHRRQREDVAHVVVDDQHLLAGQRFVGQIQILEHAAMTVRQPDGVAVQQQRALVEQALQRVDLAQYTGLRQPVPFPIVAPHRDCPHAEQRSAVAATLRRRCPGSASRVRGDIGHVARRAPEDRSARSRSVCQRRSGVGREHQSRDRPRRPGFPDAPATCARRPRPPARCRRLRSA